MHHDPLAAVLARIAAGNDMLRYLLAVLSMALAMADIERRHGIASLHVVSGQSPTNWWSLPDET